MRAYRLLKGMIDLCRTIRSGSVCIQVGRRAWWSLRKPTVKKIPSAAEQPETAELDQWTLTGPDAAAKNTVDATERVSPRPLAGVTLEGGLLRAALPPLSWNVLRLDTT